MTQTTVTDYIHSHPYVKHLLEEEGFTIDDAFTNGPNKDHSRPRHTVTTTTLSGPDLIGEYPLPLVKHTTNDLPDEQKSSEVVVIYYLGDKLCGHKGIVHGGILATILDECLCLCAFPLLPNKIAVTANLNVSYILPTKTDQYIIIKAHVDKIRGRNAWVKGTVESLIGQTEQEIEDSTVMVEADVLCIEPRWVAKLVEANKKDS